MREEQRRNEETEKFDRARRGKDLERDKNLDAISCERFVLVPSPPWLTGFDDRREIAAMGKNDVSGTCACCSPTEEVKGQDGKVESG